MVLLCLCPRTAHHCMAAAFQEVPYFRLTSLVKSTIDKTNTTVYIATPFGEGLHGNSVTVVFSAGSIWHRDCFLRVFRVEANRVVSSEIHLSRSTPTIHIQPGSYPAAQAVRDIRRFLSWLTAILPSVEYLLAQCPERCLHTYLSASRAFVGSSKPKHGLTFPPCCSRKP